MLGTIMEDRQHLVQEVIDRCTTLYIPIQAAIELTHKCNLHCSHCYIDVQERNELVVEEWKLVIEKLKAAGTMFLLFTGGEALARKDFLEIAGYARRQGFFVGLLSNFTLVTPELAAGIAKLRPYQLNTSLYGATPETHDIITGIRGSYNQTLRGIELFVQQGLVPDVQTTIMKENVHEVREIKRLVTDMGARPIMDINMAPTRGGHDYPLSHVPGVKELRKSGWIPQTNSCTSDEGLCRAGKSICTISPSGDVYPCTMVPFRLGNILHDDFNSFWHTRPAVELCAFRDLKVEDSPQCAVCELQKYCQKCIGITYRECGKISVSSPSACRLAEIRKALVTAETGG